jgi:hypothetical protein
VSQPGFILKQGILTELPQESSPKNTNPQPGFSAYDGRGEVARTQDVWGAERISGHVKFLLLAWAEMPKTSFSRIVMPEY